jgi:DNA-directed RNA polymerase specialized sigma24 family protein
MPIRNIYLAERGQRLERVDPDIQKALLKRAAVLPSKDRLLVELLVRGETPRRQIAELLKLTPGTVCRRAQRLSRRLYSPLVIALFDNKCPLSDEYRQLGVEHFLLGMPTRQIAEKHEMPVTQVRRALTTISGWFRGVTSGYRRFQSPPRRYRRPRPTPDPPDQSDPIASSDAPVPPPPPR